ncbi:VOC family protein [Rhodoligotrophos ferricapiens]|uniref:VOC family protein n=1 Tax=Rhodoligotrophos ferricapiens TaxID=3069264 RepID=UPI00315DA301
MKVHGKIWWNELLTWNAESAKSFYADIMGWSYRPLELADKSIYWIAMKDGAPVCGIYQMSSPVFDGTPNFWISCIAVDDINRAVQHANSVGGRLMHGPFHSDYIGEVALVTDGGGAVVAFVQPKSDAGPA